MRELLLLIILIGLSTALQAQTLTVTDNSTGLPIEFATIYDEDNEISAITNILGQAEVSKFSESKKISIRYIGYRQKNYSFKELEELKFMVVLSPSDIALNEVVVSASHWKQETREVPLKVTSINPENIQLQNPQTAADLLTVSGEVFVQKSQLGGGSPMIRGFATNRVLIAVDGVRMNTAIFRSGNVHNVISLDPFSIQNTEIIFGPGSVIYGSDAIGGVMSFYTAKPIFSTNDNLYARGNSTARASSANNERTVHVDVNLGRKKFASLSSISYSDFDDLRIGSNGPNEYLRTFEVTQYQNEDSVVSNSNPEVLTPTRFNQLNLMQKLRYVPNENWDINFGFHYSESSDLDRFDRLTLTDDNGDPRYADWYYGPQIWQMNNLNILKKSNGKIFDQASLTLSQQYFRESRHTRRFQSNQKVSREENVDVFTLNLDLEKNINASNRLFYGGEVVLNDISSFGFNENIETNSTSPTSTRYPDGSDWNSFSGYISHRLKVSEKINIQSGLRYSHFFLDATFDQTYYPVSFNDISINEGAFTGSLGMVYTFDKNLQVNANLSTGYRAPNIDDAAKVFDSEPGSVVVPNSNLKPEYAYNADLGFTKVFSDIVKINLTGYYTILKDALIRRDFMINGQDSIQYDGKLSRVQAIQNTAQARVYGIQAGLKLELPSGLRLSSQINIQEGEEEQEDGTFAALRHAAPTFGETHVSYIYDKLEIDVYAEYNGELSNSELAPSEKSKEYLYAKDENDNPYSPRWYTLNLNSAYQVNSTVKVSAGIDNITDQRYRPYSSGIAAPGRNFFVAVRANF
ncbi:MAG: TonB-dependent receptor [Bacteroidetes bacterium]|nr:TonB-dependent receptor [Bacteroidota bacterium]|tara:strand:- start:2618 stop:5029 length:2412 start_codon:yes stop_codon:yes gene_type:complete